ncbi:MAG: septum site-determining protein MinC [Pseudomonadota bacterium]|jgi:septum site-determining protein MinC
MARRIPPDAGGGPVQAVGISPLKTNTQAAFRDSPFQLRGANFTMMILRVGDPRNPNFFPVLANKISQAPNFFRNAPVVLDLEDLPAGVVFDFPQFCGLLRNMSLFPVGLQGGTAEQQTAALKAGLAVLPPPRDGQQTFNPLEGTGRSAAQGLGNVTSAQPPQPAAAPAPRAPEPAPVQPAVQTVVQKTTMIVTEPIRSGRQVYAQGGDLVVIGPVSAGAELVADGSIHVYGPMRGRALAGIGGDQTARIFCQSLEAELVSVAGLYRISEDMDKTITRRPVQIYLDNGYLHIEPLQAER